MIETLFMVNNFNGNSVLPVRDNGARRQTLHSTPVPPENRVLDPKKSQNIAILLRALNVTVDEVCEALREGEDELLSILSYFHRQCYFPVPPTQIRTMRVIVYCTLPLHMVFVSLLIRILCQLDMALHDYYVCM